MNKFILIMLCLILFLTAATANEYLWIEAEEGGEYFPYIVKSDIEASDQIYLGVHGNPIKGSAPSDSEGNIYFNVDVPADGTYRLWIRLSVTYDGADKIWMKMDDQPWYLWENFWNQGFIKDCWGWGYLPVTFNLTAGTHKLRLAYYSWVPKLDKMLLTTDMDYVPNGLGGSSAVTTPPSTYHSPDVVDYHGNLRVEGSLLVNEQGEPFQMRGLCTHGIQWFPLIKDRTVGDMAQYLNIDVIRPAMYIEDWWAPGDFWNGYMAHPDEMKKWEKELVEDAIDAGIYVIIDWHIHNQPLNFLNEAKAFFGEMSTLYGGYPNVIFEIANEPVHDSWSNIKTYAEEVIAEIRLKDPDDIDNIVIVGVEDWNQHFSPTIEDPITQFDNIMYALHFYSGTHGFGLRREAQKAIDAGLPLIVSEFGVSDCFGSGGVYLDEADNWMEWINENRLSWINWNFSTKEESSAFFKPTDSEGTPVLLSGPWDEDEYSPSGDYIYSKLTSPTLPPPGLQLPPVIDSGEVELRYKCINTAPGSPDIRFSFQLNNKSDVNLRWDKFEIRYYFTKDDETVVVRSGNYRDNGGNSLQNYFSSQFVDEGDYTYESFNFPGTTATLPAGSVYPGFEHSIYMDFAPYKNQNNDYSFDSSKTSHTVWDRIEVYYDNYYIWGNSPSATTPPPEPTGTPDPGATPQPSGDPEVPPTDGGGGGTAVTLELLYKCAQQVSYTNEIKPWFRIRNNGNENILWKDLELRYYLLLDDEAATLRYGTVLDMGQDNLQNNFTANFISAGDNRYYEEITFSSATAVIPAGVTAPEITHIVYVDNSPNQNQSNDPSFNPDNQTFALSDKMTIYYKGELVWGTEPW